MSAVELLGQAQQILATRSTSGLSSRMAAFLARRALEEIIDQRCADVARSSTVGEHAQQAADLACARHRRGRRPCCGGLEPAEQRLPPSCLRDAALDRGSRAVVRRCGGAAAVTITPDETPRLANAAERTVYQALLEQLQPNDRVIPGQRVTDHLKDHEVDFVVAIEGAGIVCLEVKGGDVWHDGETWWQKRGGHEHKIDPVRQAREACYALRDFIEKDDRWTQGRLRWDHVVVLPNAEIADDFALPECPRWKVIDRNDLPNLVDKLKYVLVRQELDRPLLTQQGIEQLSTALSGRGLPQRSVVARALANEDAADALTEHQAVILDAIQLLNRVEVRGGAGSGKTFLAMEQARRLSAKGQRVALVCYSHGLASYLERITADLAAPSATGLRRRVPRPRQAVGSTRRSRRIGAQRRDRPVLGARPAAPND